jgi:hypothetical protein
MLFSRDLNQFYKKIEKEKTKYQLNKYENGIRK